MIHQRDNLLDFTPLKKGAHFKVLFVYPPVRPSTHAFESLIRPQLGLAILSSCVKEIGGETALCDLSTVFSNFSLDVLRTKVTKYRPDLVAITANTVQWPYVVDIVKLCKRLGIAHVVGGLHPTDRPESVIEEADMLVIGEGEGA